MQCLVNVTATGSLGLSCPDSEGQPDTAGWFSSEDSVPVGLQGALRSFLRPLPAVRGQVFSFFPRMIQGCLGSVWEFLLLDSAFPPAPDKEYWLWSSVQVCQLPLYWVADSHSVSQIDRGLSSVLSLQFSLRYGAHRAAAPGAPTSPCPLGSTGFPKTNRRGCHGAAASALSHPQSMTQVSPC